MTWRATRRRGLTLVELMMSLAVVGLIGTAIGGMLTAVAHGTDDDQSARALVARQLTATTRLSAALRGSRRVLDAGDGWLVLWTRDLDGNDAPSLLELRLIELDAGGATLGSYAASAGTTDVAYTLSDDFDAITNTLRGTADFPETRWAGGVDAFTLSYDTADATAARLVSYRLRLTSGVNTHEAVGTAHLRNGN
ncbi:MAG: type II secretion system protein [Planctomycetota bacterium]